MAAEKLCFGSFFSPSKSRANTVPGFIMAEEAFTMEEEVELLRHVDESSARWTRRRTRITKNYGPHYMYSERDTPEGRFRYTNGNIIRTPLPPFMHTLVMPIVQRNVPELHEFTPNQLHVALYRKGEDSKIRMHNDNKMGELGPYIVGMCLRSDCSMTFLHPKTGKKRIINLPRRCVYVMTGESHHDWRHGILSGDTDEDRVSFTLRDVRRLNVEDGAKITKSRHIPSERAILMQMEKDRGRREETTNALQHIRVGGGIIDEQVV